MTPREVGGLEALAKAHGGSLTRNPETGLYEAGFLEQVLPIVAMAAATYFTAGAAAPMLMSAGMGATSAGILAGAGAGALISGGSAAIQGGDVGKAALTGGITGAIGGGLSGLGAGAEGANAGVGIDAAPGAAGAGIGPGAPPTSIDPNIAVGQSTQVGTNALNLNPSTGSIIDPLAGAPVPAGGYSGLSPGPQAIPGPNTATSSLTPTANAINSALPGQSVMPGANPNLTGAPPSSTGINTPPMNAGDRILKQQADAVAAAKADPGSSWWSKQTPVEKAAYTTAGAGILAGMNPKQTMPVEDTSDDGDYLKRISPNFRAQEPVQPNPYYKAKYPTYAAEGGIMMAGGGIANLGSYSDGGRLLRGSGDGVSDNIPATIGGHQPARLADGEFVIPARIVSELGNGSTDAGAKRLYAMMDRVQAKRKKSMGKGKFAVNSKAAKALPV
jgi:hypothetical protein